MKKSLTINAIRNGKKVSKSLGYINPDAANSIVGGFAQMVNALSNDTFVNAEVVKKMDTSEEEQQGGGATPATAKLEPTLTISRTFNYSGTYPSWSYEYNGDGEIFGYADSSSYQSNDPRFLKVDRTAKRIYLHNDTDPAVCYKIMLYATEGELYAAKYAEQEDME